MYYIDNILNIWQIFYNKTTKPTKEYITISDCKTSKPEDTYLDTRYYKNTRYN